MTCGKIFYYTRGEAKKAMKHINRIRNKEDKKLTGVYRCSNCGGYHMTSQDKSKRVKL